VYVFSTVVIGGALIFAGSRAARRTAVGREFVDGICERLPLVGRSMFLTALARFSRALALLLSSNVPIVESLDLAGAASGSARLRKHVRRVAQSVAQGDSISDAFAASGYFPQLFCWLFATGEARGRVEETLFDLSRSYEQQVAFHDRAIGQFASPLFVMCVALVVGWITIALYLPIFSLGDAISGS
jgi:type IV pilus assembly protein PilC